jgi:hypothetical protein
MAALFLVRFYMSPPANPGGLAKKDVVWESAKPAPIPLLVCARFTPLSILLRYHWCRMSRAWFGKKDQDFAQVPATRRLKTYSAESGYVYQYHFEGRRDPAEFVFTVSADRKNWRDISVVLPENLIMIRERQLTSTDRYAVAKIALFAAFDHCESPAGLPRQLAVAQRELEEVADRLGW